MDEKKPPPACRGYDPELWFPLSDRDTTSTMIATGICIDRCPLRAACLKWALDHGVRDGIWGGYTEKERAAMIANPNLKRIGLREAGHAITDLRKALASC